MCTHVTGAGKLKPIREETLLLMDQALKNAFLLVFGNSSPLQNSACIAEAGCMEPRLHASHRLSIGGSLSHKECQKSCRRCPSQLPCAQSAKQAKKMQRSKSFPIWSTCKAGSSCCGPWNGAVGSSPPWVANLWCRRRVCHRQQECCFKFPERAENSLWFTGLLWTAFHIKLHACTMPKSAAFQLLASLHTAL